MPEQKFSGRCLGQRVGYDGRRSAINCRLRNPIAVTEMSDVPRQPASILGGHLSERGALGKLLAQAGACSAERLLGLREDKHQDVNIAARKTSFPVFRGAFANITDARRPRDWAFDELFGE